MALLKESPPFRKDLQKGKCSRFWKHKINLQAAAQKPREVIRTPKKVCLEQPTVYPPPGSRHTSQQPGSCFILLLPLCLVNHLVCWPERGLLKSHAPLHTFISCVDELQVARNTDFYESVKLQWARKRKCLPL